VEASHYTFLLVVPFYRAVLYLFWQRGEKSLSCACTDTGFSEEEIREFARQEANE